MKHKKTENFTEDEKNWMDTIVVNYIVAQSDGFQLGYAQALTDFVENIIDYWEGSDDKPQESVLHTIIDLGVELGERKKIAEKNILTALERGYERYYQWRYKEKDTDFGGIVNIFTKAEGNNYDEKID